MDYILPNRHNFPRCDLFTDKDLFKNGIFERTSWCQQVDTDGDFVSDTADNCNDHAYGVPVDANGCPIDDGNGTTGPTTSPSSGPTTPSSLRPTTTPSFGPTTSPSLQPTTSAPTALPTTDPTSSPSLEPTDEPTSEPSNSPTGTCRDDPDWYYIKKGDQKYCDDIAKDTDKRCKKDGDKYYSELDGTYSYYACRLTCGDCTGYPTASDGPSPGPDGEGECVDDSTWYYTDKKGNDKTCEDVAKDTNKRCQQDGDKYYSDEGVYSYDGCPLSCEKCTPTTRRALLRKSRVKGQ